MSDSDAWTDLGYESWLEEEWVERQRKKADADAQPVSKALGDGRLKPLAAYLQSESIELPGLPETMVAIPRWLTDEIVEMVEGDHWFRLRVKSRKRGLKRSDYLTGSIARLQVGYFVETRSRELGPGHYESVIAEAIETYRRPDGDPHHRSYVTKAHAAVRKGIQKWDAAGGDGFRILGKLCARRSPPDADQPETRSL